jgi:hypothetical protein
VSPVISNIEKSYKNRINITWINFEEDNHNITMDFIERYPDKEWNWSLISNNPNITMDIIEKYSDKEWSWFVISINPNITMDIIEKYPDKKWNWH